MRRQSEKYVGESSKYAHCIGLYLSFHLSWDLSSFVHGRLQNLQTSEVTRWAVISAGAYPMGGDIGRSLPDGR